jgi:hypothetical protein
VRQIASHWRVGLILILAAATLVGVVAPYGCEAFERRRVKNAFGELSGPHLAAFDAYDDLVRDRSRIVDQMARSEYRRAGSFLKSTIFHLTAERTACGYGDTDVFKEVLADVARSKDEAMLRDALHLLKRLGFSTGTGFDTDGYIVAFRAEDVEGWLDASIKRGEVDESAARLATSHPNIAYATLRRWTRSSSDPVARCAAQELASRPEFLDDLDAVKALLRDPRERVRLATLFALDSPSSDADRRRADVALFQALAPACKDPVEEVRIRAIRALRHFDAAVPLLKALAKGSDASGACEAVGQLRFRRDPADAAFFRSLLASRNPSLASRALSGLAELSDPVAKETAFRWLAGKDKALKGAAELVVEKLARDRADVPNIVDAILRSDPAPAWNATSVRDRLFRHLKNLVETGVADRRSIRLLLEAKDPNIRQEAAGLLER